MSLARITLLFVAVLSSTLAALLLFASPGESQAGATPPAIQAGPKPAAIDHFLAIQNELTVDPSARAAAGGTRLPPPEAEITAENCVLTFVSRGWIENPAAAFAQAQAQAEKMTRDLLGTDAAANTPVAIRAAAPSEPLRVDSIHRFDLRAFDLTEIMEGQRDGVFVGAAKQVPFSGGDDATNRRFVDIWAKTAKTREEESQIRRLGEAGRAVYKLSFGDEDDRHWIEHRDRFALLGKELSTAQDATNISIVAAYRADTLVSGEIRQPKTLMFLGRTREDLQQQAAILRDWKRETCR